MKLFKLADHSDYYKSHKTRSYLFYYSAKSYWNVFERISNFKDEEFDFFSYIHVGVPIMHMSLELILKAFVFFYDKNYNPRKDAHKTHKIIEQHKEKIDVFKKITPETMELIKELEKAWEGLRYFECASQITGKDIKIFKKTMKYLLDEYEKIFKFSKNPLKITQ